MMLMSFIKGWIDSKKKSNVKAHSHAIWIILLSVLQQINEGMVWSNHACGRNNTCAGYFAHPFEFLAIGCAKSLKIGH